MDMLHIKFFHFFSSIFQTIRPYLPLLTEEKVPLALKPSDFLKTSWPYKKNIM